MKRVFAVALLFGLSASCGPEPVPHPAGAVPYSAEDQAALDAQMNQVTDAAFAGRAFRAAVRESGIQSELRPEDVRVSSYRGKPTACGRLVDRTASVRFIYRDGGAVVETNHRPDVFEEFWVKVCPLPLPRSGSPTAE